MGLFDSIRNAVGGSADDDGDDASSLLDSTTLDPTDFRTRAESVAEADGLDFSRGSLAHLETHVASLSDPETADDVAAATTYADPALRYGSYFGEVLVRAYDGAWTRDEGWGVTVAGPDDEVTVAVFDVAARSLDGDPVFAAIVERLEAELALGADANADGPSTAPEPEASADEGASDPAAVPEADTEDAAAAGDDASSGHPSGEPEPDTGTDVSDPEDGPPGEADTQANAADPEPDRDADESAAAFIAEAESDAAEAGDDEAVETAGASAPSASEGASGGGIDLGNDAPAAEPSGPADAPDAEDPDPAAGDGLRAEYAETAQEFAAFWSERDLDFEPDSLSRLDTLVDGEWDAGRFRDATFGADDDFDDRAFTSLVTELGSYFGEVLVRTVDGEWTEATDHRAAVVVATDTGALAVPVFQVAENSLRQTAVFERSYEALLEDIGRDDVA
ncbi:MULTISPECIES: hypothetical protein [Haloarcula]|uniref:hypothetical protein n=1 Tax=Haloarcula TaxID=2237 RepID=UPI0023EE01CA|nr:hypothetical protein [Halomicroarcula sp. XH51]